MGRSDKKHNKRDAKRQNLGHEKGWSFEENTVIFFKLKST